MNTPDLRDLHDLEARLRDATAAYAETVEPAPDAWAQLRGRVDGDVTRRRWARVGGGLVIGGALVAAAIAGALALADDPDAGLVVETPPAGGTTIVPGPAVGAAQEGIVYAAGEELVIVDPSTGEELGRAPTATDDATVRALQASADGSTLWYLDVPEPSAPCGTIKSRPLPLDGAETDLGIQATAFAVSPDGTRLAYATRGSGCDPSSQLSYVVIRDLTDPSEPERVWAHEPGLDDDRPRFADSVSWAQDGTRLAVGLCDEGCRVAHFDPSTDGRLVDATPVGEGRYPVWLGGTSLAMVEGPESHGGPGTPARHVVKSVEVDGGGETVLIGDLGATTVTSLAAEPASGDLLLMLDDGSVARYDGSNLLDEASGASAAAFVPLPSREPPTTADVPEVSMPGIAGAHIVYATANGLLFAGEGHDMAQLADLPDDRVVRSLQVGPDGRLWGLTVPAPEFEPCGALVDRLDDPAGAAVTLAASEFALSPDGTRLAYSARGDAGCEMSDDGRVVVRDLTTGEERVVAAHDAAASEQPYPLYPGRIAWSPDGQWLAVERCWEGCDVAVIPASTEGAALGELVTTVVGAYPAFLPDGSLVVADGFWNREGESDDPSVVWRMTLDMSGAAVEPGPRERIADAGTTAVQGVWSDPQTGDLLLLVDGTLTLRGGSDSGSVDVDVVAAAFVPGPSPADPVTGPTVPSPSPPAACSAAGRGIDGPVVAQGAVEDTRVAILAATVACDWAALRTLMDGEFSYSFGGDLDADEAIAAWQEAEAAGEPILATLADRLHESPRERDGYFTFEDPDDPLGYRAVIRADGTWTAFVAGD